MKLLQNESGSIIVFFTLMVVLLLIMVGLGLDTGWLAYTRSQGQPAVDAAALAGASGVPTGSATKIKDRIEALNTTNDYVKNLSNQIDGTVNGNYVTLIKYNFKTGDISKVSTVDEANGVRVALEQNNPYGGDPSKAINTPLFLTPLLNWFGAGVSGTSNVDVSAVAVCTAIPSFPVVITGCPGSSVPVIGDPWCNSNPVNGEPPLCESCPTSTIDGETITRGVNCSLIRNPNPTDSAGWTNLQPSGPVSKPVVEDLLQTTQTCENAKPGIQASSDICTNNGNIPPLVKDIDNYFGPFSSPPNSDDCFLIPVINQAISNFGQCEPVEKFARICLSKVYCPGCRDGTAPGVYQQQIIADIDCPYNPNLKVTGCFSNKLVRDAASGM